MQMPKEADAVIMRVLMARRGGFRQEHTHGRRGNESLQTSLIRFVNSLVAIKIIITARHDKDSIDQHQAVPKETPAPRETEMYAKQSEADRIRRQYAALTSHYRAIGPAAIVAALYFARRPVAAKAA